MKQLKAVMVVTLGLFLSPAAVVPAFAFATATPAGPGHDTLAKLGQDFEPIAAQFGCNAFTNADYTGKHSASFRYDPVADAAAGTQDRMMTVSYYDLSGDGATDQKLLAGLRNGLYRQFYEGTQILSAKTFEDSAKGPVMYIEYRAGKADDKHYGAGILLRVSSTGAAFIQIESRGQAFDAADGQKLQELVKTVVALN
ncbi:MAG: hypothetical protein PW788_06475 [Micavibrio sp.]|nr:hypothetical protein [Micavibrio sp.]